MATGQIALLGVKWITYRVVPGIFMLKCLVVESVSYRLWTPLQVTKLFVRVRKCLFEKTGSSLENIKKIFENS